MKQTARAVIIRDGRLLLVTAHDKGYYWLPGGTVEDGESMVEALHRELAEELGVSALWHKLYKSYKTDDRHLDVFLVSIEGDIAIDNGITDYQWYSIDSDIEVGEQFKNTILKDLIVDRLIV